MNNKIKASVILVSIIGFLSGFIYLLDTYPYQKIIDGLAIITGVLFLFYVWIVIYEELENK
jgi:hypothetical protein